MRLSSMTAFIMVVVSCGSSFAERPPAFLRLRFRKTHRPLVRSHPSRDLTTSNFTDFVSGETVDAQRSPVVGRHRHGGRFAESAESVTLSSRRLAHESHGAVPPGSLFARRSSTDRRKQAADFKRPERTMVAYLGTDRNQIVLNHNNHLQDKLGARANSTLPDIILDDGSLGLATMNTAHGKSETSGDAVLPNGGTSAAHAVSLRNASVPAPRRVRRRSELELLPDSYAERQTHFSASETCRTINVSRVVQPPGCLPRRVVSSACQGTCHSRSVPEWHYDSQQLRHVTYCTCCRPHQMTYRRVRFACPMRSRKLFVLFIGVASECACRPCSDGDPEARQPYDYD